MKWIKASERLPQKCGNVIFRQISSKVVLSLSMAIEWISEGDINNVEWLDESIEREDAPSEQESQEKMWVGAIDTFLTEGKFKLMQSFTITRKP